MDQALTLQAGALQDFDDSTLIAGGDGVLVIKAANVSEKRVFVQLEREDEELLARPSLPVDSTAPAAIYSPLSVEWYAGKDLAHVQKLPLANIDLAPRRAAQLVLGMNTHRKPGVYEVRLRLDNKDAAQIKGINASTVTPETHLVWLRTLANVRVVLHAFPLEKSGVIIEKAIGRRREQRK